VGGKLTFFGIDYGKSVNWEMKDAEWAMQNCMETLKSFMYFRYAEK
jgi:hypothetical protein